MNRCPLELWAKITALACSDGGYTGCSLSLVSHTMHDIVEPMRYHSVSLIGHRRLFAFAARLAALKAPPVIRHLFMSDIHDRGHSIEEMGGRFTMELWQELHAQTRQTMAEINFTIHNILATIAPRLYSLVIHDRFFDLTVDLPIFPHLHDITLLSLPSSCTADVHTRFPSLRRLYLISARTSHAFWLGLANFAPHITHLRLSNVSEDVCISSFLRILLDIPPPPMVPGALHTVEDNCYPPMSQEARDAATAASRLSTLEYLYVQPHAYRNTGWCGTGSIVHGQMVSALESIASAAARGGGVGKFFLLPERECYILDEARKDWLETVEGGDGPWSGGSVRARWPEEDSAYFSQPDPSPIDVPAFRVEPTVIIVPRVPSVSVSDRWLNIVTQPANISP